MKYNNFFEWEIIDNCVKDVNILINEDNLKENDNYFENILT